MALCGQPRVYLLFRFASNASGVSYGAFVDDVTLKAYYEVAPPTQGVWLPRLLKARLTP